MKTNLLKAEDILAVVDDAVLSVSADGKILDYSQLPEGLSVKKGGKPASVQELFPPSVAKLLLERIRLTLSAKKAQDFETQFIQEGRVINLFVKISPYHKQRLLILLRDISRQKYFEDYLRQSEARFRILLEAAPQGIILVDMHGMINLINRQIEILSGYARDELNGQSVDIFIPSLYRDKHARERNRFIMNPEAREMAPGKDIRLLCKDGTELPVEITLSSVEMYDGLYILAFVTDISDKRQLENKIRRFEKLEAVGQLAGGIAHDFNNVLAAIIGLTELAMRKLDAESAAADNLKLVLDKAQNAAGLVSQLLAFSRQQVLSPRKLNLNDVIRSNQKMLQHYLGEDIQLKTELSPGLDYIFADQSALDQIITNLSINARDAMPDGGELIIRTENTDMINENISAKNISRLRNSIKLTIADTGIGMRREVQEHIFEPFYTTKAQGEGTGLGLATVYGLIQQHNGMLQFSSSPGEGTVFTIYFPAYLKTDNGQIAQQQDLQKPAGGNETILLVDDEMNILKSAKAILEENGYKVLIAPDGQKALELFKQDADSIDLVISDVVMPHTGGVELKLMLERINPQIKFIYMSAYSEKVPPQEIELHKPFLSRDLLQKVRQVLDRRQA